METEEGGHLMEIWLKQRSKRVMLPVLPQEYQVTSDQNNTVVNVIGIGDVVLKGKRGLQRITFSSFFPMRYDRSFCETSNLRKPKEYVKLIESMKRSGALKSIITETPVNYWSTIETFEWGEQDGTGDIYYTLTLQEYRAPSVSVSSVVAM
jgi:hypothetical protein